jgi:DNA-binding CsgD family transcriptional regulator
MNVSGWLRAPATRRGLLVAAVLGGCFVWAMVIVGLSFAMVERGSRQWWLMPMFGLFVLVIAVWATGRVPRAAHRAGTAPAAPPAGPHHAPAKVSRMLPEPLSPREVEVLHQLAAGRSNREIAQALFVAPGTVKAHLHHIFRKLEAASRLQAVAHAREAGLLDAAEIHPGSTPA